MTDIQTPHPLRVALDHLKLSQPEFARSLGVAERQVRRWLKEGVTPSELRRRHIVRVLRRKGWDGKEGDLWNLNKK